MRHEKRIIEAFKANKIKRVLLIDDAYDSPELNDKMVAALADFLDGENGKAACHMYGIGEDKLNIAKKAALEGDYNGDELKEVNSAIYAEFVKTREDKFDPSGEFNLIKKSALEALLPLHRLLCKCGDEIDVRTVGLENGMKCYHEFCPEVLFVDYYLSGDVPPPTEKVSQYRRTKALRVSIGLLKQVIDATDVKDIPAIVLMSSYGVQKVNQYRHKTQRPDKIMSLRFKFLKKDWVRQENNILIIDHTAADVLLDISQGYLFGKALQLAVAQWKSAAESALKNFLQEVVDLDTKDFAYLLRFKLREEGQSLSEYLRWFFGECLKGFIDNEVDWGHYSFSELNGKNKIDKSIEGAFEGPSQGIAKFFHRVRVDSYRITNHVGYQMGDLYAQSDEQGIVTIRAVLTPGCDLVKRKGKTNVKSVLTMGGTLNTFDKKGSAADDFFLHEDKAYSVLWKPKDLEMFPITGPEALHEAKEFKFLGTLRPLYAQAIQHRVLTDLSRVGLPVAPALGINATVTVFIRKRNASNSFQNINTESSALATIIPSRVGQRDGHCVLLRRSFVNELIDRLREVDTAEMFEDDAKMLKEVLEKESSTEKFYETLLKTGGWTNGKPKFGTGFVISNKPETKPDAPWLQFVLKVPNDEMKELQTRDPLDVY